MIDNQSRYLTYTQYIFQMLNFLASLLILQFLYEIQLSYYLFLTYFHKKFFCHH